MSRSSTTGPVRLLQGAFTFFIVAFFFCATFTIAGTQTALGLTLLCWIVLVAWKRLYIPPWSSLYPPILLFIAISLVSAAISGYPLQGVMNLKNYLLMSAIPLVAAAGRERRLREALYLSLLVSAAASGLYGTFVFLLGRGEGTLGRTAGSFSNAMTFGGVMMLLSSLFISMGLSGGGSRRIRIPALIAGVSTVVALFFSFTRSSWLGMICAIALILLLQRKRLLPLYLMLLLLLFLLMPAPYRGRVRSIWDPSYRTNVHRLQMMKGGWRIFADNWLIGVGPIDLTELYDERKPEGTVHLFGHLHNNFLNIAVTLGVLGLAAFLYLWYAVFRMMVTTLTSGIPPPERAWVAGSIGALAGFLVNGLFEWNFADAEVITLVYIIIGSNLAIRAGQSGPGRDRNVGRVIPEGD